MHYLKKSDAAPKAVLHFQKNPTFDVIVFMAMGLVTSKIAFLCLSFLAANCRSTELINFSKQNAIIIMLILGEKGNSLFSLHAYSSNWYEPRRVNLSLRIWSRRTGLLLSNASNQDTGIVNRASWLVTVRFII